MKRDPDSKNAIATISERDQQEIQNLVRVFKLLQTMCEGQFLEM